MTLGKLAFGSKLTTTSTYTKIQTQTQTRNFFTENNYN